MLIITIHVVIGFGYVMYFQPETHSFAVAYRLRKIYTKLDSSVILVQRLIPFHRELICMLVTLSSIVKHENVSYSGNDIYFNH